jgi:hypothetical protein
VLRDEAELDALFAGGEVLSLARAARRPATWDLAYSALTLDLMREAAQ